jgi:hypothetical protein
VALRASLNLTQEEFLSSFGHCKRSAASSGGRFRPQMKEIKTTRNDEVERATTSAEREKAAGQALPKSTAASPSTAAINRSHSCEQIRHARRLRPTDNLDDGHAGIHSRAASSGRPPPAARCIEQPAAPTPARFALRPESG